MNDSDLCLEVV